MSASELTPEAEIRARENARNLGRGRSNARLRSSRCRRRSRSGSRLRGRSGGRRLIPDQQSALSSRDDPIDDEVRAHEPAFALFAPEGDPLHFYREIAAKAGHCLAKGRRAFWRASARTAGEI